MIEKYGLLAIVVHSGSSLHYGHYFTYMRNETRETSDWYLANDSHLSQISFESLISKPSTFKDDTPYIVFYERIKEETVAPEFKVNANLLNLIEQDNRVFDLEKQEESTKATSSYKYDNTKRDDDNDGSNSGNGSGSNSNWNTGPNLVQ